MIPPKDMSNKLFPGMLKESDLLKARDNGWSIHIQRGSASSLVFLELTKQVDEQSPAFGFKAMDRKDLMKNPPQDWDSVPNDTSYLNVPVSFVASVPDGEFAII